MIPNGDGLLLEPDGGPADEGDPATVSSLRLDKYLVTVGRYRQFVHAVNAGWLPAAGSGKHAHLNQGKGLTNTNADLLGPAYESGWVASDDANITLSTEDMTNTCVDDVSADAETWTASPGAQESLPINCVSWYEAFAFCIWDGGFLPSEAEWEYAAAGGSQQREYPWGSADPGTASLYAIYGDYYSAMPDAGAPNIAPVGTAALGVGLWGQLDLAGDLGEWVMDDEADYVSPCADCADIPAIPFDKVARGGQYDSPSADLVPSNRAAYGNGGEPPIARWVDVGFRCARAP
jgi:formylglycine-generating enzyme required for sulfatase activity